MLTESKKLLYIIPIKLNSKCLCFQPLRACILGPPAVGKTTVAKQLCEHYKIHHIKIQDVIEESIGNLVGFIIFLNFSKSDFIFKRESAKLIKSQNDHLVYYVDFYI